MVFYAEASPNNIGYNDLLYSPTSDRLKQLSDIRSLIGLWQWKIAYCCFA